MLLKMHQRSFRVKSLLRTASVELEGYSGLEKADEVE